MYQEYYMQNIRVLASLVHQRKTYPSSHCKVFSITVGASVSSSLEVGVIALHYPIVYPSWRRYDRRLPMPDKVFHGTLHERLVVQRKRQLHDIAQLCLDPRARAPKKKAQTAELPLEFLVPRDQQDAERAVDGPLRRHRRSPRRGRERRPALSAMAPARDVENHVAVV